MLSGFLLIENHVPLNPAPTRGWRPVHALITQQVIAVAHDAQADRATDDDFYKAVWVLAELGAVIRSGPSNPDGKLERAIGVVSGFDALLDITPAEGIRQLRELEAVAAEQSYPYLQEPLTLSASFPAVQEVVQAESDVIAGGVLLDYKTSAEASASHAFRNSIVRKRSLSNPTRRSGRGRPKTTPTTARRPSRR